MNIALILAFFVALSGFGLTFYGLRSIHLRETTNKPVIFFSVGITLIVIGALFFFLESVYRGLVVYPTTSSSAVVATVTPTQAAQIPPNTSATTSGKVSGANGYSSQLVQQFMTTCQATIGQQKQSACNCILGKIEQYYTPEQLQSIKSPSQLSPQATAAITSCLK